MIIHSRAPWRVQQASSCVLDKLLGHVGLVSFHSDFESLGFQIFSVVCAKNFDDYSNSVRFCILYHGYILHNHFRLPQPRFVAVWFGVEFIANLNKKRRDYSTPLHIRTCIAFSMIRIPRYAISLLQLVHLQGHTTYTWGSHPRGRPSSCAHVGLCH